MPNIGIVAWGGIGDALLITPALSSLKCDKNNVTIICGKHQEDIFLNNPHIDDIRIRLSLDVNSGGKELRTIIRQFDKVIKTDYGKLSPSKMKPPKHAAHIIANILGVEIGNVRPEIYLTQDEEEYALNILKNDNNKKSILFSAFSSCPQKNWSPENWTTLIKLLPNITFYQIGEYTDDCIPGSIDLRGKPKIREAMALVKHADIYLGVDSLWSHVAQAFCTSNIILWGPSNPITWGYNNDFTINLYNNKYCSPCIDSDQLNKCSNNNCMDFDIEKIIENINSILAFKAKSN